MNAIADALGYQAARVDDAPEEDRQQLRDAIAQMNFDGLGPASAWRRPDGSYTVMSAVMSAVKPKLTGLRHGG